MSRTLDSMVQVVPNAWNDRVTWSGWFYAVPDLAESAPSSKNEAKSATRLPQERFICHSEMRSFSRVAIPLVEVGTIISTVVTSVSLFTILRSVIAIIAAPFELIVTCRFLCPTSSHHCENLLCSFYG